MKHDVHGNEGAAIFVAQAMAKAARGRRSESERTRDKKKNWRENSPFEITQNQALRGTSVISLGFRLGVVTPSRRMENEEKKDPIG